jgi:hypothetical protein
LSRSRGTWREYRLSRPAPNGEHNTAWWPELKEPFEKFAADHPRNPYPDRLTWEASDAAHNPAHWLVIEELGPARGEAAQLPDVNIVPKSYGIFEGSSKLLFDQRKPSGRVDLSGGEIQRTP